MSEDDRMALAALALDSLSDSVDDDAILHLIATMDTEADVALLVQTGQELLEWLLQENDPVVMGKQLGSLLDAVADVDRLQRTVQRNDEVGGALCVCLVTSCVHVLSALPRSLCFVFVVIVNACMPATHTVGGWAGPGGGTFTVSNEPPPPPP